MQASPVQQSIIDARGKNILVSASAGSGKTSVLVSRLCQLVIQDRIGIDRILAMTFTEDAAGEMKTRLKKQLQTQDLNDPYIQRQLALLENASISTIHRFCLDLLQKYYYLIDIPYSMSRNVETGMKASQALQTAYQKAVTHLDPQRYASLKLYLQALGKKEEDLQEVILKFLEISRTKPDPQAWMESCRQPASSSSSWFLRYFSIRIEALLEIMESMLEVIPTLNFARASKETEWVEMFRKKTDLLCQARQQLQEEDYGGFRETFYRYIRDTEKFKPSINKVRFDALQKDSQALEKQIGDALFSIEELDQYEQGTLPYVHTFIDLAQLCQTFFAQEKRSMGIIDFSDMEQFAWQLLQNPVVKAEVQQRYQVIMVDEYQDTNDLQESIISMAAGKDNVFRVGDVKQSIYGFRQARPDLMRSMMEKDDALHQTMIMDENFRSTEALIQFNNTFFNLLMNTPGMESQFSSRDIARPGTPEQKTSPQKPVRFLYTLYGGWQDPDAIKTTDTQARKIHKANRIDLIAKDIQQRIQEGYEYRDIAILTRTSTNHATIKQGLEAYGIPLISRSKKGFYTNQAVQIVMAVLKALVNPRDDIAFMAMLCSPIGKAKQAQVIEETLGRQPGASLYDTLRLKRIAAFYKELEKFKTLPVGELVEKIYNYNDFYYGYTSAQDKTNLDLFLEKACMAEQDISLEAFTDLIMQEEKFNSVGEAIPFGREANVVKITTIHSSKGLQYPIVYLLTEDRNQDLDAGQPISLDPELGVSMLYLSANRHIKARTRSYIAMETRRFIEDQNEKMRLLYVACTRAEKELIFVDTLKNMEEYSYPLNRRAIWKNRGFTGWAAHIFQNTESPLFVMEEKDVLHRPEPAARKNFYKKSSKYQLPVKVIHSQTASSTKISRKWKPVSLGKSYGLERGTLFHSMAESLSYPYDRQQAIQWARKQNMELSDRDLEQFLSLNDCQVYGSWLRKEHLFEAPYNVMTDGALLHGYMDLLVLDGQDIHILDFKTDSVISMDRLKQVYRTQLEAYKKAVSYIYPDKNIHIWLYSFYLKEISEII